MSGQPSGVPRWLAEQTVTAQAARRGLPGPIAVGGIGGSGTRVIARMLEILGVYLGAYLNHADDNMWFHSLFNRPRWFASASAADFTRALTIFDRAMHDDLPLTPDTIWYVLNAVPQAEQVIINPSRQPKTPPEQVGSRLHNVLSLLRLTRRVDLSRFRAWGWKQPSSCFSLGALADFYPDLRYILVIRNGLDMAFSHHQSQQRNWSWLFDMPAPGVDVPPAHSLAFWVRANQAAIAIGEAKLGDRFLALDFDTLCLAPEKGVDSLIRFAGLDVPGEVRQALIQTPRLPSSMGRHKQQDLSQFDPADIDAVRRLGYEVSR